MSDKPHSAPTAEAQGGSPLVYAVPLLWPAFLLLVLVVMGLLLPLERIARGLLDWADGAGWSGPLVVTVGYTISCLFILPTSVFTFGAGFVYGLPVGLAVAIGGSTVGALVGYGVSRLLLADRILRYAREARAVAVVRNAARSDGRRVLLLTRMSPLTPFALLNYLYGALHVPPWRFLWTTMVGMLPGTFLCVYIGAGMRSLAGVTGGKESSAGSGWPYWAGLAGTAVAVVLIAYLARKELLRAAERVDKADGHGLEEGA